MPEKKSASITSFLVSIKQQLLIVILDVNWKSCRSAWVGTNKLDYPIDRFLVHSVHVRPVIHVRKLVVHMFQFHYIIESPRPPSHFLVQRIISRRSGVNFSPFSSLLFSSNIFSSFVHVVFPYSDASNSMYIDLVEERK